MSVENPQQFPLLLEEQDTPLIKHYEPTESTNGEDLYVLECYPAVQGEGLFMGAPTTFVRLAGCTVGCHYCDTKYSWKAKRGIAYSPENLAAHAAATMYPYQRLALTGGEPLEHPWPLVERFLDKVINQHNAHVTVETSGVFLPDLGGAFQRNIQFPSDQLLWSVAPKLSMARANYPFPDLGAWLWLARNFQHPVQLKFVVADESDVLETAEHLQKALAHDSSIRSMAVFLQPATNYNEKAPAEEVARGIIELTKKVQEWIFSSGSYVPVFSQFRHFYVKPQQHAIYYGAKRQV